MVRSDRDEATPATQARALLLETTNDNLDFVADFRVREPFWIDDRIILGRFGLAVRTTLRSGASTAPDGVVGHAE